MNYSWLSSERARTIAAAGVLVLLLFAEWGKLLLGRSILFFGDIALYFGPLLDIQRRALLHGRIALWDPTVLCGRPIAGNPQAWPLYPGSLLLYALPAETVTGISGALHLLWAALGTLLFLRRRSLSVGASLMGAVAWGFGGALVSKLQFPNMVQAASYLPWLLWGIERCLCERGSARSTGILGLIVGLTLLAAHPQMFLMSFYVAAAWSAWRLLSLPRTDRWNFAGSLIAALMLGILLAAAQLLPTAELARVSVRPDLTLEKANRFILPPYAVLYNFIVPNFYGNPSTAYPLVARGNFWEACAYIGILPFAMAVAAATRMVRSSSEVRFWTIAAVVCIWLAVGRDAFLFAIAFRLLPGLSRFHDAARWLIPGTFALSCLAAHCANSLLETFRVRLQRIIAAAALVALTAIDLLSFDASLNPTAPPDLFAVSRRDIPGSGRLFDADEGRAWSRFISYRTYQTVEGIHAAEFAGSLCPNLPSFAGISQFGGYEPVARADIAAITDAARQQAIKTSPGRTLPVSLINLLRAEGVTRVARLGPVGSAVPEVRAMPRSMGRAQLWQYRTSAATPDDALHRMASLNWDGSPICVSPVTASPTPNTLRRFPIALSLTVRDISNDEVLVSLPAPHPAGLVRLADTLHPGWTATSDGRPAEIVRVDGAFRGVKVEPGIRNILFRYEPESWRTGMFISLCGAGILTTVLSAQWMRGRLPSASPDLTELSNRQAASKP